MGLIAQAIIYVVAGFAVGCIAVPVLAGIGLAAVFQLEVINYLEHYGLERRPLDNGRLERLGQHHAWDDNHLLSSWLLANLTHHADHHMRPGERYQRLGMVERRHATRRLRRRFSDRPHPATLVPHHEPARPGAAHPVSV